MNSGNILAGTLGTLILVGLIVLITFLFIGTSNILTRCSLSIYYLFFSS